MSSSATLSMASSGFMGAPVTAQPDRKWIGAPARIECSSRPKKKATAHHMKTRPKKTQPWDVRRKPTVYAPLPPLPADWILAEPAAVTAAAGDSPPAS